MKASRLRVLVLLLCIGSLSGFARGAGEEQEAPAAEKTTAAEKEAVSGTVRYHEAPMLAEMVAAGELPPVEERLPVDPQVLKPVETIGKYGGTLRKDGAGMYHMLAIELFALAQDFEAGTHDYYQGVAEGKIVPNLAQGGDFSEDYETYVLRLRRGTRWSDGAPLTADDLLF